MSTTYWKLIRKNTSYLEKSAFYYTKNKAAAQDLLQDTFTQLIEKEAYFQLQTDFKKWSKVVMKNIYLQAYRTQKRRAQLLEKHPMVLAHEVVINEGENQLMAEYLETAVANLTRKYRKPFQLLLQGYRYHEIAERCDVPIGTVKTRIYQARKVLQKSVDN